MSIVNTEVQKITVSDTQDIQISEIVSDLNGTFYRSIKILGTPLDSNGNGTLVLNIVVTTNTKTNIVVDAPASEY